MLIWVMGFEGKMQQDRLLKWGEGEEKGLQARKEEKGLQARKDEFG